MTLDIERERRAFVAAAEIEFRNDEPFTKRDFAVGLRTWLAAKRSMQGSAEPVAHLKFWAAQQWSGNGNHDVEVAEGLCVCEPGEIGDDKLPAFPVYTAPPAPVSAEPVNAVQHAISVDRAYRDGFSSGFDAGERSDDKALERAMNRVGKRAEYEEAFKSPKEISPKQKGSLCASCHTWRECNSKKECDHHGYKLISQPGIAPLSTDAKDSERYQYLKRTTTAIRDPNTGERIGCTPEEFEACIDLAIAAKEAGK